MANNKSNYVCSLLILQLFAPIALAQSPYGGTGGVIQPAGLNEPYGVNDSSVLKMQDEYTTRHHRLGEQSGIGGSFLQTTSVTSETEKPVYRQHIPPVTETIINVPKPKSTYESLGKSPALFEELAAPYNLPERKANSPALSNIPGTPEAVQNIDNNLIRQDIAGPEPMTKLNIHPTSGAISPESILPINE